MALIQVHAEALFTPGERDKVNLFKWSGVTQADTCEPVQSSGSYDRSVQVVGDFGGGAIEIHGSNDGVNFSILTDPQGIALSFNSSKIEIVMELTKYLKPVPVGGSSMNLNIIILMRGA